MKDKAHGIILCICIIVFLLSGYQLLKIKGNYEEGERIYREVIEQVVVTPEPVDTPQNSDDKEKTKKKKKEIPMIKVDFETLKQINPDIVGWLYIPYSNISYPLLHTDNNDTYLKQTYDKQNSTFGSIFMDYQNTSNLSDKHTIIYGHNMKNGSMFGTLKNYCDEDFLKKNKVFYILTPEGNYRYQVFSYHVADAIGRVYQVAFEDNLAYQSYLDLVNQSSYINSDIEVTTEDRTLTLSTCTSNDDKRFVVHAKLMKVE